MPLAQLLISTTLSLSQLMFTPLEGAPLLLNRWLLVLSEIVDMRNRTIPTRSKRSTFRESQTTSMSSLINRGHLRTALG